MSFRCWSAALGAITVCFLTVVRADDSKKGPSEFELIRITDLNAPTNTPTGQQAGSGFTPTGNDPLAESSFEIDDGKVQIALRGAGPRQSYSVYFCRFGFGPAGCVLLGQ